MDPMRRWKIGHEIVRLVGVGYPTKEEIMGRLDRYYPVTADEFDTEVELLLDRFDIAARPDGTYYIPALSPHGHGC
jgi:hypothetical protein